MLKLVYDLKAGFEDKYLILKNQEYDLTWLLESVEESVQDPEPKLIIEDEASVYAQYKDNVNAILAVLEDCYELAQLYEASVTEISKLYFSHMLGGIPLKYVVPIWEPSNWRLVYEPGKRSSYYYLKALSAKETMEQLKINRQQLHYYVKTGRVRKEYNPENPKQFKYNELDVYVLQKKLELKYNRDEEN